MKAGARDLIGRRIIAIEWRRQYDSERREFFTRPLLTLDNGRSVWFVAQETDTGDYGTEICISERKAKT